MGRDGLCGVQAMKRIVRLVGYARPYALYLLISVALTLVYAAMAGFRVLLIKPIIDTVLSPQASPDKVLVFTVPHFNRQVNLQWLIPHHFHNAWTVVALALVG